jgi:hypothetical protein
MTHLFDRLTNDKKERQPMTSKNTFTSPDTIHKDLLVAKEFVYTRCGFECTQLIAEIESADYGAYTFNLNELSVKYRVAKITPTKIGQFVTLWKRFENGPIRPFDITDDIDMFIISTRNDNHFGQFIFPKSALYKKGIVADKHKEGKRAIRVYPPWDTTVNKQAQKTQRWQLDYFLDIPKEKPIDLARAKSLFSSQRQLQ